MENKSNQTENTSGASIRKFNISGGQDLPDSPQDKKKLEAEIATIDLPDVKDIPGQEHVRPAPLGEMGDTTIASDDEEGVGLFDDEEDDDTDINNDKNIPYHEYYF